MNTKSPSPVALISETFDTTGVRPEIDATHGAISYLGEALTQLDKEIQVLQEALDPVSVRSTVTSLPPGSAGPRVRTVTSSPGPAGPRVSEGSNGLPAPAERCTVSTMVVDLRVRIDDFATRVAGLRDWVGMLHQELRI